MAGKQITTPKVTTIDELRAKVEARYQGEAFEHPNGYGTFELARLKRAERKTIRDATFIYGTNGEIVRIDDELSNRMAVAYGLVSPQIAETVEKTVEALKEYPDDFIDPIAARVWEMSNDYRVTGNGKGTDGASAPFTKTSSSTNGVSPTSSSGDSAKSEA